MKLFACGFSYGAFRPQCRLADALNKRLTSVLLLSSIRIPLHRDLNTVHINNLFGGVSQYDVCRTVLSI